MQRRSSRSQAQLYQWDMGYPTEPLAEKQPDEVGLDGGPRTPFGPPRTTILIHAVAEFLEVRRLVNAVLCAESHRSRHDFLAASRDTHDRHIRSQSAPFAFDQERQAIHYRHHEVQQDDAGPMILEFPESLPPVGGEHDFVPTARERSSLEFAHVGVVFDHEYGGHAIASSTWALARAGRQSSAKFLLRLSCWAGETHRSPQQD